MERISGVVERITYEDTENGFSILKIRCKGFSKLVTITGNISHISIGAIITAEGNFVINPKFGQQFNVLKWEESLPADIHGIEKYLGSGLIKGVGPKYAKLIVDTFGTKTLEILENDPNCLYQITALGKKRTESIIKAWETQKEIKNLMLFLQKHGISTALGPKIYKIYGVGSINKIKENPFDLADDIDGIGFKTADTIAQKMNFGQESYARTRAGIFYTINQLAYKDGHCYIPPEELYKKCAELLDIDIGKIVITVDHLSKLNELIVEEKQRIYLPAFYYSEVGTSNRIKDILYTDIPNICTDYELEKEILKLETKNKIKYDELQISAIKESINSKFCVITGGAGVGKTTIIKAVIDIFKSYNKKIFLCAPTGRAAKLMTETCKMEAKTIHRLLEHTPKEGFKKNENNQLKCDVLIVDEASMVDLVLMYNLLKAVHDTTRVILIGDSNQLPSVNAGNVLKDIIDSSILSVIKLKKIYRQALNSDIIVNSHKINEGKIPSLTTKADSDFFFIEAKESNNILELISDLCTRRLPNHYKVDPIKDIQVLSPMKRGDTGVDNLNIILQSRLNKNSLCLIHGARKYRLGDKVMQIKNNYDKEVFNGDIGYIVNVNTEDKYLTVNFDNNLIDYDILELDELSLAYACTIHKAQGGEYPIVIIPITFSHRIILARNLLYTGITRAKQVLILIGDKNAIKYAVDNDNSGKRYTWLSERLKYNL